MGLISKLLFKIINRYQNLILSHIRTWLNNYISIVTNDIIQAGVFKGQKLLKYPWWSNTDRANILLGLYELEIQNVIASNYSGYDTFVNIGAADGYYLFGFLELGYFKKYIGFEASDIGRDFINSQISELGVDNIECFGKADSQFINNIELKSKNLILCDIEGYEFEIFTEANLKLLNKSLIIIEIHRKNIFEFDIRFNKLIRDAKKYFKVDIINTSSRDLSKIDLLKKLNDNQRWLLCSEGRSNLGCWLVLYPKS